MLFAMSWSCASLECVLGISLQVLGRLPAVLTLLTLLTLLNFKMCKLKIVWFLSLMVWTWLGTINGRSWFKGNRT